MRIKDMDTPEDRHFRIEKKRDKKGRIYYNFILFKSHPLVCELVLALDPFSNIKQQEHYSQFFKSESEGK